MPERYFIALVPPQAVQAEARTVQQEFVDRYDSRAALKSPPHITLQPPFAWSDAELPRLAQALEAIAARQPLVPVTLSGFGAFVPRVIYINVVRSPELLAIQAALLIHLQTTLGLVDRVSQTRPFAPHLTVGFRDLSQQNFQKAWTEFQSRPFEATFTIAQLTLLRHNGQRWQIHTEFPLKGSEATPH